MQKPTEISVRRLGAEDCVSIASAFAAQSWNKPVEQFERYMKECSSGQRVVLLAEVDGEFAGYVTANWKSDYPPFKESSIPEVADFNVLIKFQKRGVGNCLMKAAEELIAACSDTAGVRVGLDADYGDAQRLYVKRGYVPDGRGISQYGRFLKYGDTVTVDDDLVLGFTKLLK